MRGAKCYPNRVQVPWPCCGPADVTARSLPGRRAVQMPLTSAVPALNQACGGLAEGLPAHLRLGQGLSPL